MQISLNKYVSFRFSNETPQRDLHLKELEGRNGTALQQLADMVDAIPGMGPIVTNHLYEKGLSIPPGSAEKLPRAPTASQRTTGEYSHSCSEFSIQMDDGGGGVGGSTKRRISSRSMDESSSYISNASYKLTATPNSSVASIVPAIVMIDFQGDCSARSSSYRMTNNPNGKRY